MVGNHTMLLEIRNPRFTGVGLNMPVGVCLIPVENNDIALLRPIVRAGDNGCAKPLQEWTVVFCICRVAAGIETARREALSAGHSTIAS